MIALYLSSRVNSYVFMVDAADSKSAGSDTVRVRVSPWAPSISGQFFFLNAMKGTETTFIAPFFYSTLVFVMILDLALFGVIPDIISLIGASLIILGGIFISLRINFKVFR